MSEKELWKLEHPKLYAFGNAAKSFLLGCMFILFLSVLSGLGQYQTGGM